LQSLGQQQQGQLIEAIHKAALSEVRDMRRTRFVALQRTARTVGCSLLQACYTLLHQCCLGY
jgi:hypothetical protein